MKTIAKTYTVYNFNELSEIAKEQAKSNYLINHSGWIQDDFNEIIKNDLDELFPSSDLKFCYSLASCQGDGFNTYGDLNFKDFLTIDEKTNGNFWDAFTEQERETIKKYIKDLGRYSLETDSRYCYSHKFIDLKDDNINWLVDEWIENIEYYEKIDGEKLKPIFYNFIDAAFAWLQDFDGKSEALGYNFFYEISDEDFNETAEANGWQFTKDGDIF